MKMRITKKGFWKGKSAVEMQFNWIFLLIAGVLIFFLVSRVISVQRQSAEASIAVMLKSKFQALLTSAITNEELSSEVNFQITEMSFDCNGFSVAGRKTAPVDIGVGFAPGIIKTGSGNLVVKTQVWEMPFKVSNFIYLTSPEVMYVFVENKKYESLINEIYSKMPDSISRKRIKSGDLAEIRNYQNYAVRLIFFGDESYDSDFVKEHVNSRVSALQVIPVLLSYNNDINVNAGTLKFYTPKSEEKSVYLGTASLMGAIFADSASTYSCSMAKAFDKLSGMIELYSERIEVINKEYQNGMCKSRLEIALKSLLALKNAFADSEIKEFDEAKINNLLSLLIDVDTKNKLLIRNSCPEIY